MTMTFLTNSFMMLIWIKVLICDLIEVLSSKSSHLSTNLLSIFSPKSYAGESSTYFVAYLHDFC